MTRATLPSRRWIAALLALCCLTGCQAKREQQGCRMQREVVIGSSDGVPKTVAVARSSAGGYVVAWSADEETYVAALDHESLRVIWFHRVERFRLPPLAAVDGGTAKTFWPEGGRSSPDSEDLALVPLPGARTALAMLERPVGGLPGGAYLAVVDPPPTDGPAVVRLGASWPFASRIAAAHLKGVLVVAWHEGKPDSSRVRLAAYDLSGERLLAKREIPGDAAVSGPAVASGPRGTVLAWTRTVHQGGAPRSEVRAASLGADLTVGEATTVSSCRYLDPAPHLITLGDRFGLAYRDDADQDHKPEFYFAVLDARGRAVQGPARISRADGFQGPSLSAGDPLVYSAAIRSFQRNYLVGLNRFDRAGVKRGGEFQVYADKSDFIRVALDARGNDVVLVYGEDRRGTGRVLASRVVCRERGSASP